MSFVTEHDFGNEDTDVDKLLKAIADQYSGFSPQLRKAADYVLENPVDIALLPIRKVSDEAGVTPSTMMRLAKSVGFERYNHFKDVFKLEMHSKAPISFGKRAKSLRDLSDASSGNKVFYQFAESTFHDMEGLFQDSTLKKLQMAAEVILQSQHVYALGFRDAFACAHHFAYVGRIAFPNFNLVRGHEGSLLSELAEITDKDVVVVFGTDPYAMETVNAVNIVKEQRAKLIVITDDLRSPLVENADMALIVETETPHFFPTILSSIVLTEALLSECVTLGGGEMVENISRYENTMKRLGGYYSLKNALKS